MKYNEIGTYKRKGNNYVRDGEGRFTSWKRSIKAFSYKYLAPLGLIYLMFGSYMVGEWDRKIVEAENQDRLETKIEELKWKLIEDLKKYENPGNRYGLITLDAPPKTPNCPEDKFSFGKLQFKVCTVKSAYKLYYKKDISKEEALKIAIDNDKSSKLAYDMIFNTKKGDKGLGHWFNSSNKDNENLKRQLAVIRNLEK